MKIITVRVQVAADDDVQSAEVKEIVQERLREGGCVTLPAAVDATSMLLRQVFFNSADVKLDRPTVINRKKPTAAAA